MLLSEKGDATTATVRLKNRVQISSSVDKVLWEKFQQLSKRTRIPVSRLLDEAIEDSLKKYNQTQKDSN